MAWTVSSTRQPEYFTSNVYTEGLASQVVAGEMMIVPGRLAPVIFYDVPSLWLNFRPFLSRSAITQGLEREDPGIMRLNPKRKE